MNNYKKRARNLLLQMTLKEKIGQLNCNIFGFVSHERDENGNLVLTEQFKNHVLRFGSIGTLFSYFRSDPYSRKSYATGGIRLEEREEAHNLLQKFIIENTRLGIPLIIEENTPHGRQVLDGIMFPANVSVGCSFNPSLYKEVVSLICEEARLGGVLLPNFSLYDMAIDPRWGRSEECFSEDPYLASKFAENAVLGSKEGGTYICCKHYVGQGASLGAHNGCSTNIGERELREIHLPAVEATVKAGADVIMAAYNDVDGVPCHANKFTNLDILKGEFGFDGIIRADSCAIENLLDLTDGDYAKAAALALSSGVDISLMDKAYPYLEEAVEKGYIKEEVIDAAVLRLLERKFKAGIFDKPFIEDLHQSENFIKSGKSHKVAYEMATESLVLLKNENKTLPLKENQKLLLVGENLANIYYYLGDYTSERKDKTSLVDLLNHPYIEGWNFKKGVTISDRELEVALKDVDVVLFGCGGSSVRDFESVYARTGAVETASNYMDCGEGCDLASLELHAAQIDLIKKIRSYGKKIVSIVLAGRAYVLTDIVNNSDSVIFAGYPGERGPHAIKDTLYGIKNNFGRLAVSFPKHVGQLPIYYNIKENKNYVDIDRFPLFPFGHGLSYSKFEYSLLNIEQETLENLENGKTIKITFEVKNISKTKGKAVPQLYIHKRGGTVKARLKELKGFDKVELNPNESKTICFELNKKDLQEFSINKKFELYSMTLNIMIGESSTDIRLEDIIQIK